MKLGDICNKIGSGATPRGGKEAYKDSGIPIIRSQNVLDWSFSSDGLAYIDDDQARALSNVEVKPGDVLLNITGDSVARSCIVPNKLAPARVNQHVSILRTNSRSNPVFLLAWLQSNKSLLLSLAASGATRNALTKTMLEKLDISLPSIDVQERIAGIVLSIQSKIEANARLNGYLEELGQALTCKYLDSCISNCLLSDILELGNGFAFKSGAYTENGRYKVLTIKNVQDGNVDCSSSSRLDELPIKMKEHCKLKPGDVVLSLTGNVGRVGIVAETSCLLNQRVAVLLPRDEHCLAGLYFIFRQQSFRSEMIGIAKGTAQANLSPVETLRLSIPYDESAFQELSAILRPVFDGILANKIESLKLAEFRNLLLPKLMSGEIDVSKIDLIQLNSHLA